MGKKDKYASIRGLSREDKLRLLSNPSAIVKRNDEVKPKSKPKYKRARRKVGRKRTIEENGSSNVSVQKSTSTQKSVDEQSTKKSGKKKPVLERKKKPKMTRIDDSSSSDSDIEPSTSMPASKITGKTATGSLREKLLQKLQGPQFRMLNERLYTCTSTEAQKIFSDEGLFQMYHAGYRAQMLQWPVQPLDVIVKSLKKTKSRLIIADIGCGDARLADQLSDRHTVRSFDLVALNDSVTVANMTQLPLDDCSVDVAVFCLSLMNTDLSDALIEAHRILKSGGELKIAEVGSRFESLSRFLRGVSSLGFQVAKKRRLADGYYILLDFRKISDCPGAIPRKKDLKLKPCLYKRR